MMTATTVKADGSINFIGDGSHKGTDYYYSERRSDWVVVDLENREVQFTKRLVIVSSAEDGDESGLNQHPGFAGCDFDGLRGLWLLALDRSDNAAEDLPEDAKIEWDSAS